MNKAQLEALLAAGLITLTAFTAALATRDAFGVITAKPVLEMSVQATALALPDETAEGDEARTIRGTISVYEHYIPSHGMILHTGSLSPRSEQLDKIKLLRDHNMADPVGYMTEFDPASLDAAFYVPPGENGDRALLEASAEQKLRDGFSVGFFFTDYEFDADWTLHVYAAEFHEVSLCAIPAVVDAGVTHVAAALATNRKDNTLMNRAQLAAALAAGTITQEQHDAALATLTAVTAAHPTPAAPAAPAELAAGPEVVNPAAPPVTVHERALSFGQVAQRLSAAASTPGANGAHVALALEEITQTGAAVADQGEAFNRPEWIGEVWQAEAEGRPWIDSLGPVKPLTGTKIEGYVWDETPTPEKYEGDLEEVPSNGFSTKKKETEPERWAWAARIDRIFRDLGTPDLAASLLGKVTKNYERVSDFDVAAQVLAGATVPVGPAIGSTATPHTSVLGAVGAIARDFRTIGAKLDQIWLAEDLFEAWSEMKIADLPAWLALSLGVSLTEGKSIAGNLTIEADSKMTAGTVAGYDKRAVSVYEKSPITLEALVIPNGGIDIGWFSYGGILINDKRAIEKRYVDLP